MRQRRRQGHHGLNNASCRRWRLHERRSHDRHDHARDTRRHLWDIVKAGANEAAKQHGIDLKYSSDPDFTKQAVLVQNAIDSGVDGIAMTAAGPSALGDVVRRRMPQRFQSSCLTGHRRLEGARAMMYFGGTSTWAESRLVTGLVSLVASTSCASSTRRVRLRWRALQGCGAACRGSADEQTCRSTDRTMHR